MTDRHKKPQTRFECRVHVYAAFVRDESSITRGKGTFVFFKRAEEISSIKDTYIVFNSCQGPDQPRDQDPSGHCRRLQD